MIATILRTWSYNCGKSKSIQLSYFIYTAIDRKKTWLAVVPVSAFNFSRIVGQKLYGGFLGIPRLYKAFILGIHKIFRIIMLSEIVCTIGDVSKKKAGGFVFPQGFREMYCNASQMKQWKEMIYEDQYRSRCYCLRIITTIIQVLKSNETKPQFPDRPESEKKII